MAALGVARKRQRELVAALPRRCRARVPAGSRGDPSSLGEHSRKIVFAAKLAAPDALSVLVSETRDPET